MRTFKQWVREDEELIKKWLKAHGVRFSLMGIAWVVCLTALILAVVFGLRHARLVVDLAGIYVPKKGITGSSNLFLLYVPFILFNFAFGNPLRDIFRRKDSTTEDRRNATYIFCTLILTGGYLISIGA